MSTLFERMAAAQAPDPIPSGNIPEARPLAPNLYADRFKIEPPADAEATYHGWIVWYDWGDFEHGICYRETKWRARSRSGELIAAPDTRVGDLEWLKAEIDRREKRCSAPKP